MFDTFDNVEVISGGQYNGANGTVTEIYHDLDVEPVYMVKYKNSNSSGMFKQSELRKES